MSKIEWTDVTWNPTTGCTRVSAGCDHCYIDRTPPFRMAGRRFDGPGVGASTGVRLHADRLTKPLSWRLPRRVFVNSLSDLFHDKVDDAFIAMVFAAMALTARHQFQVLTKRPARMHSLLHQRDFRDAVAWHATMMLGSRSWQRWQMDLHHGWQTTLLAGPAGSTLWTPPWPLPNVWLGVSVENQQWADIRIPYLLNTPAAVRWLSCEPLLGPVDVLKFFPIRPIGRDFAELPLTVTAARACGMPVIDWVIAGGESGRGARPMHPDWARELRDQCLEAEVPFFFKQWGEWAPATAQQQQARPFRIVPEYAHGQRGPFSRGWGMLRVGKRNAGRELDGRTWDQFPAVSV